jgi:hypothetical protein
MFWTLTFKKVGHSVDPESIDAKVEPEGHGLLQLGHNLWVVEVEVGLLGVELVQVVFAALLVVSPSRTAKNASLEKKFRVGSFREQADVVFTKYFWFNSIVLSVFQSDKILMYFIWNSCIIIMKI